jgi:hypothetical protein
MLLVVNGKLSWDSASDDSEQSRHDELFLRQSRSMDVQEPQTTTLSHGRPHPRAMINSP